MSTGSAVVSKRPEIRLQIRISRGATITDERRRLGVQSSQKFKSKSVFPEERRLRSRGGVGGGGGGGVRTGAKEKKSTITRG